MAQSTKFANLAIGLDAAYCNVVGLIFVLTGAFMADWLGVAGWVATVAGIVILAWALVVTLYANRKVARRSEIDRVIAGNAVWILLAAIVIAIPGTMSSDGKWLLALGTLVVVVFVLAQLWARRSLTDPVDDEDAVDEAAAQ